MRCLVCKILWKNGHFCNFYSINPKPLIFCIQLLIYIF